MKSNSGSVCLRAALVLAFAAASARAGETPIDLSAQANEPWTYVGPNGFIITNGSTFPEGSQNFGGIPFAIPGGPNNYWAGGAAADFGSGAVSLTIPVGVSGVTSAFTLLNTMWGRLGPQSYLFITFNGNKGATATEKLVGGVNVRDYNNDGDPDTINNTTTVQAWDNGLGQRLDRQAYKLPAEFASQVLTSVTITDTGDESVSRAVLAALTVSTCHAYVTEGIAMSGSRILYHPGLRLYTQDVYLSNTSSTAVAGPLFLMLEDLPAGVSLVNESRPTACYAPLGSPYVIALPKGSLLAPNTTLVVHLGFTDPSGAAISYTPLTVSGQAGAP